MQAVFGSVVSDSECVSSGIWVDSLSIHSLHSSTVWIPNFLHIPRDVDVVELCDEACGHMKGRGNAPNTFCTLRTVQPLL